MVTCLYFQIWNESNKIKNIAVEDVEQHGKIYEDGKYLFIGDNVAKQVSHYIVLC